MQNSEGIKREKETEDHTFDCGHQVSHRSLVNIRTLTGSISTFEKVDTFSTCAAQRYNDKRDRNREVIKSSSPLKQPYKDWNHSKGLRD